MIEVIKGLQRRIEVLERSQNKTNIRGIISEIDPQRGIGGSVRVSYGNDQLTDWLPVKPLRAGKAKVWWFPEVNEAVTVTDIETGEVIPGSYTATNAPATRNPNHMRVDFGDGSHIVHDRESGKLKILAVGDIEITTKQNAPIMTLTSSEVIFRVPIKAPAGEFKDSLKIANKELKEHKHGGVIPGGGSTAPL